MESNTKINPRRWIRTGQTFEEKLRQQLGKLLPNEDYKAIITLYDHIAPRMQNAFQVCVLNGEPHAVANVVVENEKIPLLRESVKNNWMILRASCHQYAEYPLVYVRMGIFFSATRLQQGKTELTGVVVECLPDFTDADFQEWVITMRKTLYTILDIYDLEDRNLISSKICFQESVVDDLIKAIDQANSSLEAISKMRRDITKAVEHFYRDYPEPFLFT